MASSTQPQICVLGIGAMGAAIARRLRDKGHSISIWNKTRARAEALASEEALGTCTVAATPAAAAVACTEGALVLVAVSDTASVLSILHAKDVGTALVGKVLVNLTSGNPDEGREIATAVAEVSGDRAVLLDGAYCGNPTKARTGTGQLFLSSERMDVVEEAKPVLAQLGSLAFCGGIGASRALDYAVVDLFFVNLLSFMSNAGVLEREGVAIQQVVEEVTKRLAMVPAALEMYHKRMASRDESAYRQNITVTLGTSRSYWASRLSYNAAHDIPSHLALLFIDLLDEACGGDQGPATHTSADVSRLQEVVRYSRDAVGSTLEPAPKRAKLRFQPHATPEAAVLWCAPLAACKTVHFLRHAQAVSNVAAYHYPKFSQAWEAAYMDPLFFDAELSEVGVEQCRQLGERLRTVQYELVVTSPLQRALQTATFALKNHSVPWLACDVAREYSCGRQRPCDARRCRGVQVYDFPHMDFAAVPEGEDTFLTKPESELAADARCAELLALLRQRSEASIVVVSHDGFLSRLFSKHLRWPGEVSFQNCEVRSVVLRL